MSSRAGALERLVAPRVPVDGIGGVLQQIRTALVREAIHAGPSYVDDARKRASRQAPSRARRYNPCAMDLAVETHGLTRDFGIFRAVDGIDLAVPAGSFYGFLGPNGAGKSTTIKCLTGLLRPTGGTMRILGIDPLADPVAVKRRIGVVPEDLALFDRLTAPETLTFVAQVHGIDVATARAAPPICST